MKPCLQIYEAAHTHKFLFGVKLIDANLNFIHLFQDASLDLFPDTNFKLASLERVHISGPFGNALIKYLLRGAENIKSLALGIEWLDPAFCSTQPEGRSDFLGKEYLVRWLNE